jgi:thiol-disulfide isomerase/thioredoxin
MEFGSRKLIQFALCLAVASLQPCRCQETRHIDREDSHQLIESSSDAHDSKSSAPALRTEEEATPSSVPKSSPAPSPADLQVIQLSSSNFDSVVTTSAAADGNGVVLIEFYADWCSHCVSFASTYAEIAKHFHSQQQSDLKVKVARVNVDQERALAMRFGVHGFPAFYIVDSKRSVYVFEQARTKKNLMDYAAGGYLKDEALPFYSSPMGPLGLAQGALINTGARASALFAWLQATFQISPILAGTLLFGSMFMGCFVVIVVVAIVFTPKAKVD